MEIVSGEGFELTEAIETEVALKAQQIKSHLKEEGKLVFHLGMSSPSQFSVKIEVKAGGKFVVGSAEERDFHKSLNEAKARVLRQIDDLHEKKKSARH
jgi:ribosomal subunit interface protein